MSLPVAEAVNLVAEAVNLVAEVVHSYFVVKQGLDYKELVG